MDAQVSDAADLLPGQSSIHNKKLVAGCGEHTSLELKEVQLAGKKRMSASAFLNGYQPAGEIFGA